MDINAIIVGTIRKMDINAIIVGTISGVLASLIAWWISYRLLAPSLSFSDKIKKSPTKNTKTGYYYQFKFGNLRKHTSAMDISLRAALYLPEFPVKGVTNIYTIPTGSDKIFEMSPKIDGNTGWSRRISLNINDNDFIKVFNKTYFQKDFQQLGESKMLTLEDVLSITPGAFIKVYVSAANSYSGSRRLFKSINYRLSDIIEGKYDRFSLAILPYKNQEDIDSDYFKEVSNN